VGVRGARGVEAHRAITLTGRGHTCPDAADVA
jgi:hypothetical protein